MKHLFVKTATALGLAAIALTAITPALADRDDRDGWRDGRHDRGEHRGWRNQEWRGRDEWRGRQAWREREWREHHRGWYGYGPYGRGYYDGPVYYRGGRYYGPGIELNIHTGF